MCGVRAVAAKMHVAWGFSTRTRAAATKMHVDWGIQHPSKFQK